MRGGRSAAAATVVGADEAIAYPYRGLRGDLRGSRRRVGTGAGSDHAGAAAGPRAAHRRHPRPGRSRSRSRVASPRAGCATSRAAGSSGSRAASGRSWPARWRSSRSFRSGKVVSRQRARIRARRQGDVPLPHAATGRAADSRPPRGYARPEGLPLAQRAAEGGGAPRRRRARAGRTCWSFSGHSRISVSPYR